MKKAVIKARTASGRIPPDKFLLDLVEEYMVVEPAWRQAEKAVWMARHRSWAHDVAALSDRRMELRRKKDELKATLDRYIDSFKPAVKPVKCPTCDGKGKVCPKC